MWYGTMWWLVPLLIFLVVRGAAMRGGRWQRHGHRPFGPSQGQREYVQDLRRLVDDQRVQIEQLEGRLGRVEDGLEFAERLLAERALPTRSAEG